MHSLNEIMEFLQKNGSILILGVALLLLVLAVVSLRQMKRMRGRLEWVNENMEIRIEELKEECIENERKREIEQKCEKEAAKEAERQKEKQKEKRQQEAVFDAVLQEIFP